VDNDIVNGTFLDASGKVFKVNFVDNILDDGGTMAMYLLDIYGVDTSVVDIVGDCSLVMHEHSSHKQANPTWTSLIGDPARILATFPNGVEGTWIPEIPDGTSKDFDFNRKFVDSVTRVFTEDNGTTWTYSGVTTDSTNNNQTIFLAATHVGLYNYETKAHFTEDSIQAEVKYLGNVYATCRHDTSRGGSLVSSLIGKVPTSTISPSDTQRNINQYTLTSNGQLRTGNSVSPIHDSIAYANPNSATVKTLDYTSSEEGVANLFFVYKEMIYDSTKDSTNELIAVATVGTSRTWVEGELCHIQDIDLAVRVELSISGVSFNQFVETAQGWVNSGGATVFTTWDGNGFGDDDMFQVVNNQESFTDDNGNIGVRGTAKLRRGAVQYFSTEM
jgi:hypothetical protein